MTNYRPTTAQKVIKAKKDAEYRVKENATVTIKMMTLEEYKQYKANKNK